MPAEAPQSAPHLAWSEGLPPIDEELVAQRVNFLSTSESWSRERHCAYQIDTLGAMLRHCRDNVPFYTRWFAEYRFDPERVRSLEDLHALPLIAKETVKASHTDFVAKNFHASQLGYLTSGGSTGDPLKVIVDSRFRSLNTANTHYYMHVAGFEIGKHPSIRLHGNPVSKEQVAAGRYWQVDGMRLNMSVHHLTPETVAGYVAAIDAHQPEYIHAFASALAMLCHYMQENGICFKARPKALFLDSETLFGWHRELFETVIGCPIYNIYGHTEGCTIAITFPGSRELTMLPQLGVVEILRPDGTPCEHEGESGEIVVTGFNNMAFPLVRYRTRDVAVLGVPQGPRALYPVLKEVTGRVQDFVIDWRGNRVAIAPLLFEYNFDWSGIDRFQIFQNEQGKLTLRILPLKGVVDGRAICARLKQKLGDALSDTFEVEAELVDAIRPTERGKFRYVDQRHSV